MLWEQFYNLQNMLQTLENKPELKKYLESNLDEDIEFYANQAGNQSPPPSFLLLFSVV